MTTNTTPASSRAATGLRRTAAAITGLAITTGALLAGGHAADASRPSSDAAHVADAADAAVRAFERWQLTDDVADFQDYADHRKAAAIATADELGASPEELRRDWSKASLEEQQAVLSAITQLGTRYRSLGSSPETGFDCSGLTSWAYAEAGVDIPRTSGGQISDAERLADDALHAGALVHYPGHVGLYVGAGLYVHSPYSGATVEITTLPERSLSFGDLVS